MGEFKEATKRQFVVRTPGKLILSGEHAVVYGKLALAASVDLLTEIHSSISYDKNPLIIINLEDLNFKCSLNIAELAQISDKVEQLRSFLEDQIPIEASQSVKMSILAICYLYNSIVRCNNSIIELCIRSDIPIGAGLGSSAAFSVGCSATFHLLNHAMSSKESFTPNLEVINRWAFQCEKMFHATPSGIDNAVCTYGGVVKFQKTVIGSIAVPEARILLVNTGVSRQTKLLVEAVRSKRNNLPSIVEPILDSIDQLSHKLAEVMLEPANYSTIQDLLSINHWLLASLGVSHASLDEIHRLAHNHQQAAKLTGAGGGGLAFVWLDPACTDQQLAALKSDLSSFVFWPARLGVKGLQVEELS